MLQQIIYTGMSGPCFSRHNRLPGAKRTRDCLLPRRASAVSRVVGLLFSFSLHVQPVIRQIQTSKNQLTLDTGSYVVAAFLTGPKLKLSEWF